MVTARRKIQDLASNRLSPYNMSKKNNLTNNIINNKKKSKNNNYLYGFLLLYLVITFIFLLRLN